MDLQLNGTRVLVTGGTRGIGAGLVKEFLARGCQVSTCGRTATDVPGALSIVADVTDEAGMQKLWDETVAQHGRVDVWINNAGISAPRKPFAELDLDEARRVVDVNLLGAMTGTAVALRGFLAQGHGQLWNMEGFGSGGQQGACSVDEILRLYGFPYSNRRSVDVALNRAQRCLVNRSAAHIPPGGADRNTITLIEDDTIADGDREFSI